MKTNKSIFICILLLITIFINGCSVKQLLFKVNLAPAEKFSVHFLNVGKADCILILCNKEAMLIDAGYEENGKMIVSYIKALGISKLDYVVATHPDKDHIGGLPEVINNFEITNFYMPDVEKDSSEYTNLKKAIKKKSIKVTVPKVSDSFTLGKAVFTVLAPKSSYYEDINDYSIVLKAEYGSKSFLFMGDAEEESENEIMKSGYNLKADVLKVSHHGSNTANKEAFLKAVSPQYAVVMVGESDNDKYSDEKVYDRLEILKAQVFRTDKDGTIIISTDGKNISVEKK